MSSIQGMTAEQAAELRKPFPAELVGKLPRVWCKPCRDSRGRVCDQHQKVRCHGCGNTISTAHLHLDYVGHAEATDRLLQVDPSWSWEPVAFSGEGLPLLDGHGGLWIRLTVAGVTRLGYGHADDKSGPDAVKEAIGDAIRNAAMRFGVALDLWGAKFKPEDQADEPAVAFPRREHIIAKAIRAILNADTPDQLDVIGRRVDECLAEGQITDADALDLHANVDARLSVLPTGAVTPEQIKRLHTLFSLADVRDRDAKLRFCAEVLGRDVDSTRTLTKSEAGVVMDAIEAGMGEVKYSPIVDLEGASL